MKRDLTWATALILVLPGPRARADDPPPVAITYDKGFKLTSGDARFVLKTAVRSQFRLEGARPAAGGETQARFYIPRLRLQLEGQAFGPALTYKLELGASEKGATMVKDAYLDDHVGAVHLRAGQFKRPFNRQELVSDFAGVFNERSLASEHVGGGRDAGVMVHNGFEHSPRGIEWALGLFDSANGGKDRPLQTTTCKADAAGTLTCTTSAPSNVMGDFGPAVVARAGWNFGKLKGYSEADLEGGPLRAGIGVNYKVDLADFDDAAMVQALGIDFVLKVRVLDLGAGGFLTIGARSSAGDRPRGGRLTCRPARW